MAKTNWQDPKTGEIISPHISGLQEAVRKIEESIGINSVVGTNIPLAEVFISNDDRYRIFQAPIGKRNWLLSPTPVVKRNGVVINSGFELDYGGGAIVLNSNDTTTNTYTVDATHTVSVSNAGNAKDLKENETYQFRLRRSVDGNPELVFKKVVM